MIRPKVSQLTGRSVGRSYQRLLTLNHKSGGNGTNLIEVKDGDGNTTFPIKVASNQIQITDGSNDFDVASHDSSNGLKLGGTLVTSTAAELNYNDTGSAVGTVVASKTVTADANKDVASFRNITLTGELDAGSLDVSGNADIDGTLEADAITVDGVALGTFVRDTVGTNMVSSNTESGITVTYDTSNDNIDFSIDASQTTITSLLASAIKIGEDDETKIDFETANEIHLYANNVEQVYLADNIFGPQSDSDVDLGTTGVRWKDAYIDTITTTGNVTVAGTLSVSDGNITNVGDIALDTISSDAGTSVGVTLGTDAGDDFIVATDKFVVEGDTHRVGIGTATPDGSDWNNNSTLLHVYQNDTNGGIFKIESSNTTAIFSAGNNQLQVGTVDSQPFKFYTGGALRMTIDTSGNIGATTGTNIFNASDERLKKNISSLSNSLDIIEKLNPVKFNWIDDFVESENDKTLYGFLAQEVQDVFPDAVESFTSIDKDGNPTNLIVGDKTIDKALTVREKFLVPLLTNAMKELLVRLEALENA